MMKVLVSFYKVTGWRKAWFAISTFLVASICCSGQPGNNFLLQKQWEAWWIDVPGEQPDSYGVYLFRKQLLLADKPESFVIHVSADNRYKLFVNGKMVSLGPARGDLTHWNFETIDISGFLKSGDNIIAAKVWNEAAWRPEAQLSLRTGFILQAADTLHKFINTDTTWKCVRDDSYKPIKISLPAYYVAGPGEQVDMSLQVKKWGQQGFDDKAWKSARRIFRGSPKGILGAYGTPEGWLLTASSIPPMELKEQRFSAVRKSSGVDIPPSFPVSKTRVIIPANTEATILLDQSFLTNAYLTLILSGGKQASVSIAYTEALFEKHPFKGNRNEVDGKIFMGRYDSIIADGSLQQIFTTLWWRTYRYVRLHILTKDSPLVIDDIFGTFTGYPFDFKAKLQSEKTELNTMLDIGWHTARLCAVETYMDCPYYEQLQYIGDARIQALVSLYNSGDDRLLRNALALMDHSRQPEGVTQSRHPSFTSQYIPTFSLWYIGMLHDYWMYGKDSNFVKSKLAGTRDILNYFHSYQQEDGSLKDVPYWLFTDWVGEEGWDAGTGPFGKDGNSAILDLQLLWAYQLAADMEDKIGMKQFAALYQQKAARLKSTINKKYWNNQRNLFADRSEKDLFSQHTNSLAILTGAVSKSEKLVIAEKMLADTSMAAATIYFKYYLHQALIKAGLGNDYLRWLDKWRENIRMGLTTWAEMSDVSASRSDCHAWGSSPNIEFFRTILGIDSDAPGFSKVRIEPHLGELKNISGEIPHPNGTLSVSYVFDKNWKIAINLPKNTSGTFIWNGKTYPLKAGKNAFSMASSISRYN